MNQTFKSYRWLFNSRPGLVFGAIGFIIYTCGLFYFDDQWVLSLFEGNKILNGFLLGALFMLIYLIQSAIGLWGVAKLNMTAFFRKSISAFLTLTYLNGYLFQYLSLWLVFHFVLPETYDISIHNDLFFSIEHFIVLILHNFIFTFGYSMVFKDPALELLDDVLESVTYLKPIEQITSNENSIISIQTDTTADSFDLDVKSFVYARAEGNYTDVFIQNESTDIKKETKRILISKLDQQIEESGNGTSIFRTHKSYIVNLNMIDSFKGNSNGVKIYLRLNYLQEIPVSRANVSSFKTKLEDLDLV